MANKSNETINSENDETKLTNTVQTLIEARRNWEKNAYKTSNDQLYQILADCLGIFRKAKGNLKISLLISGLLESKGITYNASTSLALKVLRLVFLDSAKKSKSDQRLFVYQRVIMAAEDEEVDPAKLSDFIKKKGGIDELRRRKKAGPSKGELAKEYELLAVESLVDINALSNTNAFKLSAPLMPIDGKGFSLALVRADSENMGTIVFGTNDARLVGQVLSHAGKKLASAKKATQVAEEQRELEGQRQADFNDIVAEVRQETHAIPA